jgi:hypothetical protein
MFRIDRVSDHAEAERIDSPAMRSVRVTIRARRATSESCSCSLSMGCHASASLVARSSLTACELSCWRRRSPTARLTPRAFLDRMLPAIIVACIV